MKTLVKMHLTMHKFVDDYFGDVNYLHYDRLFKWCNLYEDMLLRLTYPALTQEERDVIIEKIMEGKTADEILEELGLEDRDEIFRLHAKALNELEVEEWERYREE